MGILLRLCRCLDLPTARTHRHHLFLPSARASQMYDKDHMGNKRIDVCGPLLAQQVRTALFRVRAFVERGLAKGMTCNSEMARAVRDLRASPGRNMATVQAAVIAYFESHTISKFIAYSMATGNWSTSPHVGRNAGNSMAAAVAVKTGVLQQLTDFAALFTPASVLRDSVLVFFLPCTFGFAVLQG